MRILPRLFHILTNFDVLADCLDGLEVLRADINLHGIVQKFPRDMLNRTRPRRREEKSLPVWANLRHDLADLRLEAHVEHSVGLVEDEVGHAAEVRSAGLEEVDEPPRGCDDNLDSSG